MKKLYEWISKHKVWTIIICSLAFVLPLVIVHALFKYYFGIDWLVADWESGDVLSYIAGFEAFIGTVFLGIVSFEQNRRAEEANKKLAKENNYLQKVMSQKLMPVVKIGSLDTRLTIKNYRIPSVFPGVNKFTRYISHIAGNPEQPLNVICVNIDVAEGVPAYTKTISFSICNVSEAVIRHICVDDITICGYEGKFSEIRCSNEKAQNGFSSLFTTNDLLSVQVTFYFNSEEIKLCWDSDLGGLAISMFLTNTTISGIRFQEFMDIRVGNDGYKHISYGEGVFKEDEANNA